MSTSSESFLLKLCVCVYRRAVRLPFAIQALRLCDMNYLGPIFIYFSASQQGAINRALVTNLYKIVPGFGSVFTYSSAKPDESLHSLPSKLTSYILAPPKWSSPST